MVSLVGIAEKLLTKGIKDLFSNSLFSPNSIIIIHPMEKTEEGLSEIEERIFKELAAGAGARKIIVWLGYELGNTEVVQKATDA
jgi:rod shape-determining protein MreB